MFVVGRAKSWEPLPKAANAPWQKSSCPAARSTIAHWAFPEKARELARIVIAPKFQNCGYGRLLVQKLCDRLAQTGCRAVHLLVAQENTFAQRMYQTIGFQNRGTCHRYEIDFFVYEKEL